MKPSSTSLAGEVRDAQLEFYRLRAGNDGRRRIPDSFWQHAAQLAQTHSINSVSQAMRLSHAGIKARLKSAAKVKQQGTPARFVELASVPSGLGGADNMSMSMDTGLTLQLSDGTRRHVQVAGADAHSAAQLVTAFFGTVAS